MAFMLARAKHPWNVGRALAQLTCCFSSVGAFSGCPAILRDGIPFGSWLGAPCKRVAWASDTAIPAHRKKINTRLCRTVLLMACRHSEDTRKDLKKS